MTGETTANTMGSSHSGFSTSATPALGEAADVGRFEYNVLDVGQLFEGLVSDSAANNLPSATPTEGVAGETAFAHTPLAGALGAAHIESATGHPIPVGTPALGGETVLFDLAAAFAGDEAGLSHGFAGSNGLIHPFLDALHIAFA
jgi:hypothetical protein